MTTYHVERKVGPNWVFIKKFDDATEAEKFRKGLAAAKIATYQVRKVIW